MKIYKELTELPLEAYTRLIVKSIATRTNEILSKKYRDRTLAIHKLSLKLTKKFVVS